MSKTVYKLPILFYEYSSGGNFLFDVVSNTTLRCNSLFFLFQFDFLEKFKSYNKNVDDRIDL